MLYETYSGRLSEEEESETAAVVATTAVDSSVPRAWIRSDGSKIGLLGLGLGFGLGFELGFFLIYTFLSPQYGSFLLARRADAMDGGDSVRSGEIRRISGGTWENNCRFLGDRSFDKRTDLSRNGKNERRQLMNRKERDKENGKIDERKRNKKMRA